MPDPLPLPELLAIALLNRPELHEQQAAIRQALLSLNEARALPFGADGVSRPELRSRGWRQQPRGRAGRFEFVCRRRVAVRLSHRTHDLDAALYWSLQNLGVTNLALIKSARANLGSANLELVRRLNDVRAEVAIAHARIHARLARIGVCKEAVGKITTGYSLDLKRIYGGVGLCRSSF